MLAAGCRPWKSDAADCFVTGTSIHHISIAGRESLATVPRHSGRSASVCRARGHMPGYFCNRQEAQSFRWERDGADSGHI